MTCPYLEYRRESAERPFDEPRAYCTVVDRFVQPMRADVCNDRYDLDHAEHCEIFLAETAEDGSSTTGENEIDADDGSSSGTSGDSA